MKTKRVAIVGPECTGKTSLARALSLHFSTVWVPEYARIYLDSLNRSYTEADLLQIARGQIKLEDELCAAASNIVICDTNLLVIKIWSEYKYKRCHSWITEEMKKRTYHLHLLTHTDIPWEDDPQREHPHEREKLFSIYKNELVNMNIPFVEILGNKEERKRKAVDEISKITGI